MRKLRINGRSIDCKFDVSDADDLARLESAYENLAGKLQGLPDNIKGSEQLRTYCHGVFEFFNELFGEGTDRLIFGNTTNARVCLRALKEFSKACNAKYKVRDCGSSPQ